MFYEVKESPEYMRDEQEAGAAHGALRSRASTERKEGLELRFVPTSPSCLVNRFPLLRTFCSLHPRLLSPFSRLHRAVAASIPTAQTPF